MARLPQPGADNNTWGDILNEFLKVEHNPDGTLKRTDDIDDAIADVEKGQPGGVATLDGTGKVPTSQLPPTTIPVTSVNTRTGDVTGLAEQSDLTAHTTNTSNPHGVTKSQVGLGSVDDTSDLSKPVSTATQTALNLKAPLANPTFTGVVTVPTPSNGTDATTKTYVDNTVAAGAPDADATTKGKIQLAGDLGGTAAAPTVPGLANKVNTSVTVNGHALSSNVTVTKSDVDLGDVDNTTDAAKPISTLTQTALNTKVTANTAITGATKTKIMYDSKGLVTAGDDATTADIADSTDKRYVTDAQLTSLGNLSGTNTGDQDLSALQPLDSDLTAIAGISASNDDIIQRKSGTWTNRTPAQVKSDLSLTKSDVDLASVDNTSDATKNAATAVLANKTLDNTNAITIKDTSLTIQDDGDATKQFQFDGSGITTGTTRTFTVPNSSTTLVGTNATQTLSAKTLTSPVINGSVSGTAIDTNDTLAANSDTILASQKATKAYVDTSVAGKVPTSTTVNGYALTANVTVTKSDVGLGNVDNTSDATKNSAAATLTNKRVTPRVTAIASSATPTINTDNCDAVTITALATAITNMSTNVTGTPANFDKVIFRIKDDGVARAISWGSLFEAKGVALPTTTVANKVLTVGFMYDTVASKWGCIASVQEA